MIVVKRSQEDQYKLVIDGEVVKIYETTVMKHPWDWKDDALANGATESQIRSRDYEFVDER